MFILLAEIIAIALLGFFVLKFLFDKVVEKVRLQPDKRLVELGREIQEILDRKDALELNSSAKPTKD